MAVAKPLLMRGLTDLRSAAVCRWSARPADAVPQILEPVQHRSGAG
jgi:hypothetical protein